MNPKTTGTAADLRHAALLSVLRSCRMFAGVAKDDLAAIANLAVVKTLSKGEYLFREGELSHGFYIVQTGAINVHRVNAIGKEQVIRIFRPGDSFAEATLSAETGFPADARAIESSQVLLIERAGFVALLKRQPELALRMLGAMSLHLRVLVEQLEDLTLKDVETRLAAWLIRRCPDRHSDQPVTIELGVTKRVLASELGTVSETLSRTFAKFREQNLLHVEDKQLTVLSPAKLNTYLLRNLGAI